MKVTLVPQIEIRNRHPKGIGTATDGEYARIATEILKTIAKLGIADIPAEGLKAIAVNVTMYFEDILSETGEERSKLHKYLNVLIAMDVLCRDVPEGEDPSVSRRGMYYFEDNAYRFWYRYVLDNRDLIARGYDPYRIEGWQTE